ncbi:hypothetical protein M408DRAFT_29944 [Serendipita vermifera MAFF 305830]|uniref:Signal recognition particle receptor subunit beta n=1 Tax=Serendipita vermifera MAFF 305830 TaxID=933852 RepID=A0A0C3ANW2_SERVB|nr:hypothetical protein M408DRAFT_29944 [Serendipita vermifera MAFF 305830]
MVGGTILLVEPSDGGKTAIYSSIYQDVRESADSSRTTSYLRGEAKFGTAKVTVLKASSSTVAKHLHLIMSAITNVPPSIPTPPLLVFAYKADLLPKIAEKIANSGLALTRTQTILERELEKRRQASLSRGQTGAGGGVLPELGEDADAAAEGTALGGLDIAEDAGDFVYV